MYLTRLWSLNYQTELAHFVTSP